MMELAIIDGKLVTARRKRGAMNKTEQRFSEHLDLLLLVGELKSRSKFEPQRIELAIGTVDGKPYSICYTPDFSAVDATGRTCFYDVKGVTYTKSRRVPVPYVKEAALVRIKVAASKLRACIFYLAWEEGGNWRFREIKGT